MTALGGLDGLAALPLPLGEPVSLWRAATTLRAAAADVSSGALVSTGGRLPSLERAWAGPAAQQAGSEAALLAGRISAEVDRLLRGAVVLGDYGDALDAAQRSVTTMQRSWDTHAFALAVPGAVAPELAHLTGAYAVVVAELSMAGDVAAHRIRALVGEAAGDPAGGPRGRGGQGSAEQLSGASLAGTGGPGSGFDAAVRAATLVGLDLVTGRLDWLSADHVAHDVAAELERVAGGDPLAIGRALAAMGSRVRDPVFAQALWSRLTPDDVTRVLATLARPGPSLDVTPEWFTRNAGELVTALGTALVTAANPDYAVGLDLVTARALDGWRRGWLAAVTSSVRTSTRQSDGGTIGGAWTQGQLLAAAARAGLSPGVEYASSVGVALVASERAAGLPRSAGSRPAPDPAHALTSTGQHAVVGDLPDDPILSLQSALAGDVEAARAWLLHPLSEDPAVLVIDHLVGARHLLLESAGAAASMAALGQMVVAVGSDRTSPGSTHVAAAFVGAVARTSMTTPDREAFDRALAPALWDLATVVGSHTDAVTGALDGSSASGTDAAALSSLERLVRPGRVPGTFDIVIADRAAVAALVGEIALDAGPAGDSADGSTRGPDAVPALRHLVDLLGTRLENDLVAAVAADHGGDTHALEAAAGRLGATVGFTLTSAGTALAGQGADADAENRAVTSVAQLAVDKLRVAGPAGVVATPLVRYAAEHVLSSLLPTDAEAAQRAATDAALARAREQALVDARTLVSRARPWDASQSPEGWAATVATGRPVAPFWDARGTPLPESVMTTAQRRSFTDWRRAEGLSVYDTVPQEIRDAIDAGTREAADSAGVR